MELDNILALIGLGITIIGGIIGLVWKIHNGHVRRLEEFRQDNHEAHTDLHGKIDSVNNKSAERHLAIRDKIDEIWKAIVKERH